MPVVVSVSFRETGKVYPFDPNSLEINKGDRVVAETARGIEVGVARSAPCEVPEERLSLPLRPIIRLATAQDLAQEQANRERESEALGVCAAKVARHALPMKLLRAEYTLDRSRIVFFFSAEGRVDFRELVKDLAGSLRTRIELHQVGARDAAKLLGGLGRCGREVCCGAWLTGFEPVSMRMAKDQDLALNPSKFSGQCGKLMCCLRYEVEFYREARMGLPRLGALVPTPAGEARVVEINVPAGMVRVEYPETGAQVTFTPDGLRAAVGGCPHAEGTGCAGCPGA